MRSIISFAVLIPWWLWLSIAGGVYALADYANRHDIAMREANMAALAAPAPAAVDLSDFDSRTDPTTIGEVTLTGWIDPAHAISLSKVRKGGTDRLSVHLLFGRDDVAEATAVRAAMILDEVDARLFRENRTAFLVSPPEDIHGAPLVVLNGYARTGHEFSDRLDEALSARGLTRSEHFVFVAPFLDGREAALTPRGTPGGVLEAGERIALVLAVWGLILLFWQKRPGAYRREGNRRDGQRISSRRARAMAADVAGLLALADDVDAARTGPGPGACVRRKHGESDAHRLQKAQLIAEITAAAGAANVADGTAPRSAPRRSVDAIDMPKRATVLSPRSRATLVWGLGLFLLIRFAPTWVVIFALFVLIAWLYDRLFNVSRDVFLDLMADFAALLPWRRVNHR